VISWVASSDQFYDCSEKPLRSLNPIAPTHAPRTSPSLPASRGSLAWLTHPTVSALRKTRLPVCPWKRPWAEVLCLDQPPRRKTSHELCPSGMGKAGLPIPHQLPERAGTSGRSFGNQHRTIATKGVLVSVLRGPQRWDRGQGCGFRSGPGGNSGSQHGRSVSSKGEGNLVLGGGG
jgi:hypothetical protein